jgi:hypothetical protein
MKMKASIENIALKYGMITFGLLSIYFLLLTALGLVHRIEFRLFNAIIMFYGCFTAVGVAKQKLEDFNFLKGYGSGLLTALLASFLFSFFGVLYLHFIDPSFMQEIRSNELLGIYQNKFIACAQIFIEGTASGFLFTHGAVMWFKKPILEESPQKK